MKYQTKVIFKKLKLYNSLTGKLYLKWDNHKIRKYYESLKEEQIKEIEAGGRYFETTIGNSKFIFDIMSLHDYSMLSMIRKGEIYEPEVTKFIEDSLEAGNTFVDIGANNGYYTVLAAQIVGKKGTIYSFEPNIEAFERLTRNIKLNNLVNVKYYNTALSNFDGNAKLYLDQSTEDGSASLFSNQETYGKSTVMVKKFDEVFKVENEYSDIDMIKMDVEGSEINILRGMENYLNKHKKVKIIAEWNATYRTIEDFVYLNNNFNILLLLWEGDSLQQKRITKFYEVPGFSNLLLIPK